MKPAAQPAAMAAAVCVVVSVAWMGCNAIAGIQAGTLASTSPTDDASPDDDGGSEASTTDAAPGAITGKQIHYYVSLSGPAGVPANFTMKPPTAYVPLLDGGATAYPGTGDGQGNFTIDGVPPGPYYIGGITGVGALNNVPTYVYTDLRTIDLSEWTLGRTDEAFAAATPSTGLVINTTGLLPWEATDRLLFGSANVATWNRVIGNCAGGGTTCIVTNADWEKTSNPFLIDSTRNDDTYLLQHRVTDGGLASYSVGGVSATGFSIVQGKTSTFDAAMAMAPTVNLSAAWDHDSFTQLGGAINPNAALTGADLEILVSPVPFANGIFGFNEAPLLYNAVRNAPQLPAGVENITATLVNPFPSSWPLFFYVSAATDANIILLGTANLTGSISDEGLVDCYWDASKLPAQLQPVGGPVSQPLVAGQDAFRTHVGVGTTPVLAWSAPALGTPTRYNIYVIELTVSATNQVTGSNVVARLVTQGTQVTVPPGVMTTGNFYYFKFETGYQVGAAPQGLLSLGSPNCTAAAVSAAVAP